MLKTLCYIEDRGTLEYIAISDSGRLATRVKNPLASIPEILDLERVLKEKLDSANPKPEGLEDLIAEVHQYNETVSAFERVRYVKSLTPQLASQLQANHAHFKSMPLAYREQCANTVINMQFKEVKVEKDGE